MSSEPITRTGPAIHTPAPNPEPDMTGANTRRRVPVYTTILGQDPFGYGTAWTSPQQATNGNGGGNGGAPSWACILAGLSPGCSYGDILAVGAGHVFGGGQGSEPPSGGQTPGLQSNGAGGPCPGITSVYDPITGRCINLGDLAPGGDPAATAPVGQPVHGRYGVGVRPGMETITRAKCPAGFALGKDGICYEGLHRNSPRRKWPMGQKPLMTAGDRAAIRRASKVANKLKREKKSLKKASRALDKVC